ncbi:hypothetical protein [Staphylococcus lutrae]|uniref:Uncharacterized protein n=1 Tax=Staphylococcus lutrae TaxID=155085 RepID=A0AAC9WIQ2_9STAP|nr:hypothetical protein [Staphylococcus lutrae]ARJ50474.1 hypothetical protein B5P37_03685 [Staphylococcus lutrae]PNZ38202.1 hypothetical protein CD134_04950 [Staphylococcus lutrae]
MNRIIVVRGIIISIILGLLFFFMNQAQATEETQTLLMRSIFVACTFALLYFITFSLLNNESRKRLYGPPLLIGLIGGILIGQLLQHPLIGVGVGVVLGLLIGMIRQRSVKE